MGTFIGLIFVGIVIIVMIIFFIVSIKQLDWENNFGIGGTIFTLGLIGVFLLIMFFGDFKTEFNIHETKIKYFRTDYNITISCPERTAIITDARVFNMDTNNIFLQRETDYNLFNEPSYSYKFLHIYKGITNDVERIK